MSRQPRILFTKPLSDHRRTLLDQMVEVSEIRALEPVLLPVSELPETADWVFVTSPHALESVRKLLANGWGRKAKWATVGFRSQEKIADFGFEVMIKAHHAKQLVSRLPKMGSAIYLCGKDRTPTIENYLSENDWDFTVVETYWTQATHPQVDLSAFDAVAFFSPRNVDSVLRHNAWPNEGVKALAIGPTTGQALINKGIEPEVISEVPDVLLMTQQFLEIRSNDSSK